MAGNVILELATPRRSSSHGAFTTALQAHPRLTRGMNEDIFSQTYIDILLYEQTNTIYLYDQVSSMQRWPY